jgi:hypothetical protein
MIDVAVLSFTVLFLLTTSAIVLVLSVSQNFERYSRKCTDYRLTVQSRVAQLANSCNRIACKVQPFERMEAEHYKTIYESTQTHWHVAQQERRNAIFQLRRWVFPVEVPSALSMSERLTFVGYATSSFNVFRKTKYHKG